ncbi:LuxR C-terminal-related transcriptional regulator [Streptomyces sp. LX-29]|uniref:LuxR family transcriptional regulator n=1 Tax=Streptomyces sp. LX-29 TaxID=2900152 RepID=UPI00240E441B|nr:LuxR family transcriptional regulator [Streptomyces sp. LX-29]WFB11050.1 LuxR C-terminal-related transcriptional regulator [Streptomyces sp. LX-29]
MSLVFAESLDRDSSDPVFHTELLRQASFQRVRLGRLSRHGVDRMLAAEISEPAESTLHQELWAASGGNPLLLRALLEEHRLSGRSDGAVENADGALRLSVGGPFAQAVLACLHRSGAQTAELAAGAAVLGAYSTPELLGGLLGAGAAVAARRSQALSEAGILDGGHFRHPVAEAAVLEHILPQRRLELHRRAARLLHTAAVPSREVARHLLAARHTDEPWATAVLQEAADEALERDEAKSAIDYLELASAGCPDERLRASIRIRIAFVTWRLSPFIAEQHLAGPVEADRAGLLSASSAELLGRLLLMHGRTEPAGRGLAPGAPGAVGAVGVVGAPEHARRRGPGAEPERAPGPHPLRSSPAAPAALPALLASSTVWLHLGRGVDGCTVAEAERALDASPLMDTTLPTVANYLKVLSLAGHPERAATRGRRLYEEAGRRDAPGWQALLCAVLAEVALMRGRFAEAEEYGRLALGHAPVRNRSIFGVGPTVSRILACTAMGRYAEAGVLLEQPVPDDLFNSLEVLPYLRARGRYYLATSRHHAGLGDFLSIGWLARKWGVDRPALLPWRIDAAEALLALGRRACAEHTIREQLAAVEQSPARVRGMAWRAQAAVADEQQRPRLLAQAVDELHPVGDGYELARTLADLADAYQTTGDVARSSMMKRRAWQMAGECGAQPLCDAVLPGHHEEDYREFGQAPGQDKISDSERRVAALAAHGYTNREIAAKLFITVSTVEQHLTRVYRKLNISRRQDLSSVDFTDRIDESA